MTATATDPPAGPAPPRTARPSRLPLVLGLALAVAGGAGGFLAVRMDLLGGGGQAGAPAEEEPSLPELAPAAFVPIPALTVNLRGAGEGRLLRFAAQAEVAPEHLDAVTALVPRMADVLNGYLRAVEPADLDDPAALLSIRSQLLRRLQVVAGGDRVRDLLVMEFVVN